MVKKWAPEERYCIGKPEENVRPKNQGRFEVVKEKMAKRVSIDILGTMNEMDYIGRM